MKKKNLIGTPAFQAALFCVRQLDSKPELSLIKEAVEGKLAPLKKKRDKRRSRAFVEKLGRARDAYFRKLHAQKKSSKKRTSRSRSKAA